MRSLIATVLAVSTLLILPLSSANARTRADGGMQSLPDRHSATPFQYQDITPTHRIVHKFRSHRTASHRHKTKRTRVVSISHEAVIEAPSGSLLEKAKSFLGTNPTGWSSLWCGKFMAMLAPAAASKLGNPNWARDWAELPKTAPKVGAVIVLRRGRGGHVGIVAGFTKGGDPIVISGNHGHRVGIGRYSRSRVIAYVEA